MQPLYTYLFISLFQTHLMPPSQGHTHLTVVVGLPPWRVKCLPPLKVKNSRIWIRLLLPPLLPISSPPPPVSSPLLLLPVSSPPPPPISSPLLLPVSSPPPPISFPPLLPVSSPLLPFSSPLLDFWSYFHAW